MLERNQRFLEFAGVFDMVDVDDNGVIQKSTFKSIFRQFGLEETEEAIHEAYSYIFPEGTPETELDQITAFIRYRDYLNKKQAEKLAKQKALDEYEMIWFKTDLDRDRVITPTELEASDYWRQAFTDEALGYLNINGDGNIQFDEVYYVEDIVKEKLKELERVWAVVDKDGDDRVYVEDVFENAG